MRQSATLGRAGWLPLVCAVIGGALLGWTRLGSLDLPLMLANGERILADGAIPRTNVFSWTNPDHAYLNDKWLFMVLVAAVERLAGTAGLAALKAAFGASMAALLLLFGVGRRGAGRASVGGCEAWTACGLALLGTAMFSYRLHLRAEWLSYLGVVITLLLLPGVREGRRRSMAAIVLLVPVWAASHGYWVLGPAFVGVAAVADRSIRTALVALLAAAAASISPFGVSNLLHPLGVLGQLGDGVLGEAITELRAPFTGPAPWSAFHVLAVALTLVAVVALVRFVRLRAWCEAALLTALLAVAWRLDRNLALLGVVPPLVAATRWSRPLAWCGPVALVVAVAGTALGMPRVAVDRAFGAGAHAGRFPVTLLERQPTDRTLERYVNDLSLGSWLVRERGQAFVDGNTEGYPASFLARYRRILTGEESVAAVDEAYHPDGWLLRTSATTTRAIVLGLFLDGTYAPEDWDDVATLFRPVGDDLDGTAEERWRTWLRDAYLPRARAWFPTGDEARTRVLETLGIATADSARVDVPVLRAALRLAPWDVRLYDDLARAYSAAGDAVRSARCRVWAHRLRDR